jgi:hypothetical protein
MTTMFATAFLLLSTAAFYVDQSTAYPTGPPVSTIYDLCQTMTPQHNVMAQTTAAPYQLMFNVSCYTVGQPVLVNISAVGMATFTGFLIEARKPNMTTFSYGSFNKTSSNDNSVQALDCFCSSSNAVGHNNTNEDDWTMKQFVWTAPSGLGGDIQFVATMVKDTMTFWAGMTTMLPACSNATDTTPPPTTCPTTPQPNVVSTTSFGGAAPSPLIPGNSLRWPSMAAALVAATVAYARS